MSFSVFFCLKQVDVALKNKMDLSLGVALGSSSQIALLVVPFSVSWVGRNRWKLGENGGQNGANLFLNGKGVTEESILEFSQPKKNKQRSLLETKEVEVEDGWFLLIGFLVG